jgi:hypothetical protein
MEQVDSVTLVEGLKQGDVVFLSTWFVWWH